MQNIYYKIKKKIYKNILQLYKLKTKNAWFISSIEHMINFKHFTLLDSKCT